MSRSFEPLFCGEQGAHDSLNSTPQAAVCSSCGRSRGGRTAATTVDDVPIESVIARTKRRQALPLERRHLDRAAVAAPGENAVLVLAHIRDFHGKPGTR